ncbi:16S rRNA (cytosine967-C5)-methyltransferase [Nitrosomonas sp. Nm51]|uniref:RsmB/NOP family class I SAM-dependent RNA methyltransferase n=1 Tax=Nitrosomonas sp. Nm51 TaxID=133720 RepID=UPI0008C9C693|nr:RsmB/NOP family class I SAM-dependent RNA methyltransferase [Nitrosomonas sp. Nm51]SEQ82416.1 16S rRNA (cytosine967-C5)-methyltransferase [Nitrosomonas sp. Nm51]
MHITPAQLNKAVTAIQMLLPLEYPADAILRRFFQHNPKLGVHDRAFIAETAFGMLRHRFFLERCINPVTPRSLLLAYLVRFRNVDIRKFKSWAQDSEMKWLQTLHTIELKSQPLTVQAELPEWLIEKLRRFMSNDAILRLGLSLQNAAPLDVRVNTLLTKREHVLETLINECFSAEATSFSPCGIRLHSKPAINRHPLFLSGKIEVQDEGSQLLGYLMAPKRGEMIVDFCAGAGGKTLLLGALMHSKGRVYAFDINEKRLNNLKPRLKRSGLSNVHIQRIANEHDLKIKRLAKKIDRVLVDAPCSGLGTLRRNPDLKWRLTPQSIEELKAKQSSILSAAATMVKPGGRLVYATCSFLPEENQRIIENFQSSNAEFDLLDCSELLAEQKIMVNTGKFLQLSPDTHKTDGFFAAALEHKKR